MSKILVFVSKQQDYQDDRSGSTMILLFADKSLILGPGAKPEMYLVKAYHVSSANVFQLSSME
jgi:hypothetical protein